MSTAQPGRTFSRRVLCALRGHRPQLDVAVSYPTHYPHPCRCGQFFGEHDPCTCEPWRDDSPPTEQEAPGVWCDGCRGVPGNSPCQISYCLDADDLESPDLGTTEGEQNAH